MIIPLTQRHTKCRPKNFEHPKLAHNKGQPNNSFAYKSYNQAEYGDSNRKQIFTIRSCLIESVG